MIVATAWLALAVALAPVAGDQAFVPATAPAQEFRADTASLSSRALGRERTYFVALPESHPRTQRSYPVLIVLDGEYLFEDAARTATVLARLGHIPEAIVVGVPNNSTDPRDRVHDMTPPGLSVSGSSRNEGGERFLDFLEHELLPELARRYRGGAPAMLLGWSSGGVIGTHAAATRPAFQVVVAIDAPIFLDDWWLARQLADAATGERGARPLRYVSVQAAGGWPDSRWDALAAAAPPGWRLHRAVLDGESHETIGHLATYEGLKSAFRDYSVVGAPVPPRAPAGRAFAHYDAIATELGGDVPPPAAVLNRLVFDLLVEGLVEPARRALDWSIRGYGDTTDEAQNRAMIERVAAYPPLRETVSDLLATPPPSPSSIAPYLGTWTGDDGPNREARFPLRLRVRIDGGRAVAESIEPDASGQERWRTFEYLKVTADGLEFGRMNGMRPLGVWVWSGRLAGDVIEGTAGFRGIVLPLPDGHSPPTFTFRLRRTGDS